MKIPNSAHTILPREKVVEYLLSESHPLGKHKARFFKKFGFLQNRPKELIEALKNLANNDYISKEQTMFGVRYMVEAPLEMPDGRNPLVRSIWFVARGRNVPLLVTAHPAVKGRKR